MSKPNVALSSLVTQAWDQLQGQVLKEIRQRIEELAEAERETRLGRARHARGGASPWRRWGYRVRKVLLTPWKRRGFTQALRQVVIDDGDPWIWKISEEVFRKLSKSWIVPRQRAFEPSGQGGSTGKLKRPSLGSTSAPRTGRGPLEESHQGAGPSCGPLTGSPQLPSVSGAQTGTACATQNFMLNTSVLPREYWRPDVRWSSGHD